MNETEVEVPYSCCCTFLGAAAELSLVDAWQLDEQVVIVVRSATGTAAAAAIQLLADYLACKSEME